MRFRYRYVSCHFPDFTSLFLQVPTKYGKNNTVVLYLSEEKGKHWKPGYDLNLWASVQDNKNRAFCFFCFFCHGYNKAHRLPGKAWQAFTALSQGLCWKWCEGDVTNCRQVVNWKKHVRSVSVSTRLRHLRFKIHVHVRPWVHAQTIKSTFWKCNLTI